ncbi:MAG TPA: PIN domain-containing protein [Methylomirabilota bacterium]|nr:PIN domain-containing protein [Methylomirabilota bacterium]
MRTRQRATPRRSGGAPDRLFVDSGAWIALVSARDRRHAEADAMFREAAARRIRLLTTNLIVAEVHRVLRTRVGARAALRVLDRFEASPLTLVEFATGEHHRAARVWLERLADLAISYTDAVSFAVMEATRCAAALSFDRGFERAGFRRWRAGARA